MCFKRLILYFLAGDSLNAISVSSSRMTCRKSFSGHIQIYQVKKKQENEGERQRKPENGQQNEKIGQIRQQTQVIYRGLKGQLVVCCLSSTGNTGLNETSEVHK